MGNYEVFKKHLIIIVLLLQKITLDELDRLLGIVVDVENLFMCVHKEEDADTKQVQSYPLTQPANTFARH